MDEVPLPAAARELYTELASSVARYIRIARSCCVDSPTSGAGSSCSDGTPPPICGGAAILQQRGARGDRTGSAAIPLLIGGARRFPFPTGDAGPKPPTLSSSSLARSAEAWVLPSRSGYHPRESPSSAPCSSGHPVRKDDGPISLLLVGGAASPRHWPRDLPLAPLLVDDGASSPTHDGSHRYCCGTRQLPQRQPSPLDATQCSRLLGRLDVLVRGVIQVW